MLGCAVIGLGPVDLSFSMFKVLIKKSVVLPPVFPTVALQILQITCCCRASDWKKPNHYQTTEPILYLPCPDKPDKKNKLPFATSSEKQSPVSFLVLMPTTCPLEVSYVSVV